MLQRIFTAFAAIVVAVKALSIIVFGVGLYALMFVDAPGEDLLFGVVVTSLGFFFVCWLIRLCR